MLRSLCCAQMKLNFSGWNCSKSNTVVATESHASTMALRAPSCQANPSKECYRTHGHSVGSVKHCSSANDCCAACQKAAGCAVYSLDPMKNNTCWLLDEGAKTATKNRGCLSGTTGPVPPPLPGPPPAPTPTPSKSCTGRWGCFIGPDCTCNGRIDSQYNCL